ncbi:MAG: agmatinase [Methanobacteriota archaeon]|nr:MAG: agmatinase [Euryarchaeota archaeon]|tara:strand:+ start:13682 stop:14581 length:900 start_codon:yes stop_codon:yes gene_type:complete
MFERMGKDGAITNFLGLPENKGPPDIIIASIPYELTTSFGQGTEFGPAACIEASSQVELYDDLLKRNLPADKNITTVQEWNGEGNSLHEQLNSIAKYAKKQYQSGAFPIFLGGEHGILPAILRGCPEKVTLIQIDAHADLRNELNGERYSHACAISRSLDEGAMGVYQLGIRAYSNQEAEVIENDKRVKTWFAKQLLNPFQGQNYWNNWLENISDIEGPVHLTVDLDGLDSSLVPATGTPVPGGLSFWHVVQTIETAFANCNIISADVNEIVPQKDTPLTQFTAAMIVTKIIAAKIHRG